VGRQLIDFVYTLATQTIDQSYTITLGKAPPMAKRTQINLRLEEDQKDRWEEHVEDNPRFNSLSDYIRYSVEEQIERDEQ
jgi:hypothetical protein